MSGRGVPAAAGARARPIIAAARRRAKRFSATRTPRPFVRDRIVDVSPSGPDAVRNRRLRPSAGPGTRSVPARGAARVQQPVRTALTTHVTAHVTTHITTHSGEPSP
ncbi:hypothetical protein Kpho01_36810 [Kitasatospora phosalacinea]|uniref:Uncharacterized protein n=1 Tax=Kitasatospora phosalacinea TaxID=2065 RepID=A0A9W6PGI5_9ACTN|nr:hypothetical protein Kpho01_36810 [Kitasatospora phosalacinea]